MGQSNNLAEVSRPGSHAIVHGEDPIRFYAESQETMDRVLGVCLVAQLPANKISSDVRLQRMRRALREQRWADALVDWIDETGRAVDVYDYAPDVYDASVKIWAEDEMGFEKVQSGLRMAPLFRAS